MLYLCKLRIEQKNIMEKEQSNNQQSVVNNQQYYYYIQQSIHSNLKICICVRITQQDLIAGGYTNCLVLDDENTAKAMTCLLNNIDVNDNPQTIFTKFNNIYNRIINRNLPRLGYQIEYKQNGLEDKNPQTIYI